MTAHAIRDDEERCLAAGMDGYIAKPIDAKKLFEQLEALAPAGATAAETADAASPTATPAVPPNP